MATELIRLNGALGARLEGIDFDKSLQVEDLRAIEMALAEHQVICIPAATMSAQQHLEIARYFGEPEHHVFFPNLGDGLKYVTVLDSKDTAPANSWHSDEQFLQRPPRFTLTHAKLLPAYGGSTGFVSLAAAYEGLSEGMQTYLSGLSALHDYAMIAELRWQRGTSGAAAMAETLAGGQQVELPLVMEHPPSGRKVVFASQTYTRFISKVPALESRTVLDFLFAHFQKPEYQYWHRWQEGDLLIWDNRSTLHYAAGDYSQRRVMHRISVLAPESD